MSTAVERAAKVFAVLKQAAERNEVCPKSIELAHRFNCGIGSIPNAVSFLEANGMIEVARAQCSRVITICSTGKRTKGAVKVPHHTQKRDMTPRIDRVAEMAAEGVPFAQMRQTLRCKPEEIERIWSKITDDLGWQAA